MLDARDRYSRQSYGTLHSRIKQSRVLLVGAGGIGCELLKNLVLTGFGEIHIVDLDTIDLSNLNRQFLFRHEHIKKSKALVAKESATKFNPHVKLEAHHANIKDSTFNVDWFRGFNLVFNALDNLEARRHVNKMCLAANVPLIESGTTGFNGQVQVIIKGQTECYDCNTKEVPKSFPVCTIRSTPSQPIHCIVWAKSYLFTEIFGVGEDDPSTFDHSEDTDNANEIENLRKEANALKEIRSSMGSDDFPRLIFEKVFVDDINRLRGMEDMWKSRSKPSPSDYNTICQSAGRIPSSISLRDQSPWSLSENFAVFLDSLKRLTTRMAEAQQLANATSQPAILTFDKDDVDTLDFVAATANLRAIIFGIEPKSKFDVKQMAGNIIPAIATTNAMIAGLCVLQAFKVMKQDLSKARNVFLERSTARVINSEALRPPNPDCAVCGVVSAKVSIDPSRATLDDLVQGVLRKDLGYGEEFSVSNDVGVLYDPDLDDNLEKKLGDLGVKGDSFLTIIDDDEEAPRVNVSFAVSEISIPEGDGKPVKISESFDIPKRKKKTEPPIDGALLDTSKNVNGPLPVRENGANGVLGKRKTQADAGEGQDTVPGITTSKRKRSSPDNAGDGPPAQATKKGKTSNTTAAAADDDDVLVVVDDPGDGVNNGAIVIDD